VSRTEFVPKGRYRVYLHRAEDFQSAMESALQSENWNSVGLLAVHSTISACNALCVAVLGQRSTAQDHSEVRNLISSMNLPSSATTLKQISDVLSVKNRVEYESREFTESEAREVRKKANRILSWARDRLSNH